MLYRALAATSTSKYGSLVINLAASVIIARIMAPAEIGLFAVAASLFAMAHAIRDFGISNYIVQEPDLTTSRIRTANTVAYAVAWPIAVIMLMTADPIANFFSEPRLADLIRIISIGFFLLPIGSVTSALLRRRMRFTTLAAIQLTATFVSAISSVLLAFLGFGAYGLAIGMLANTLLTIILTVAYANLPLSHLLPGFNAIPRVFHFSGLSFLSSFCYTLGTNGIEIVMAKLLGFTATGFYSRADGAIQMITGMVNGVVRPVAFSYFAAARREQQPLEPAFAKMLNLMLGLLAPMLFYLGVVADAVLLILFGPQWAPAADPLRWLCVAQVAAVYAAAHNWVLLAVGDAAASAVTSFYWNALRLGLVMLAAPFGLEVATAALLLANLLGAGLLRRSLHRHLVVPQEHERSLLVNSSILALGCAFTALLCRANLPDGAQHPFLLVAVTAAATGTVWLLLVFALRHPLGVEILRILSALSRTSGPKAKSPISE